MIYPWQEKQWMLFSSLIQKQQLPHALLLQGNTGIGKHDFANLLAKSILCKNPDDSAAACNNCESCRVFEAQTHPDLIRLKPLPPEKSTSKMPVLSIKVDAIRDLCSKLTRTSQFGGFRVAIIENADEMVISASNSLLKTLEEPGSNILMILISSKPARLPVTIRSRCRKIRFEQPDSVIANQWLTTQGVKNTEIALQMCHGSPLLAQALDETVLAQRELMAKAFTATLNNEAAINYATPLSNIPKELALDWLTDWVNDVIRLKSTKGKTELINSDYQNSLIRIAKKANHRALFRFYDSIFESRKAISIALNPQLFWENLLISWDNL